MKKIIAGGAALFVALASLPAAAEPFQGPYVGAQVGWNHDDVGRAGSVIGTLDVQQSKDAVIGGVYAGYNHRFGSHAVVGLEGSFDIGASDRVGSATASIDPDYAFDVALRAGYLVNDKTLLYVRGGYENLNATVRSATSANYVRGHDTFDGWTVGGGVERALNDRFTARIEYRYADLSSDDGKFDRHQALVGVAYHF